MPRYVVAAEHTKDLESQGLRAGRRVAASVRVPDGTCHAFDLESERVACGYPVSQLVIIETLGWSGGFLPRCDSCTAKVGL